MTEYEKARAYRYDEIDLNKLAEEIRARNDEYRAKIIGLANAAEEDEFEKTEELIQPAMDISIALNVFLMRIGLDTQLAPLIAGGIEVFRDRVFDVLTDEGYGRELARATAEKLSEITVTYRCNVKM